MALESFMIWGSFALLSFAIIAFLLTLLFVANKLNKKLRQNKPDVRSYQWGYFYGCAGLVIGLFYLFFEIVSLDVIGILLPSLMAVSSYFTIKRKRAFFIILTIISFNPIVWIINGIYIKNRWDELKDV